MLCWNSSPGMAKRVPDEGILLANIMALFIPQCSSLMTPFFTVAVQQSNTPFPYAFWQTTGINFETQGPWAFKVEHPFYENHTSYMIVSLLRTEESPIHLLNLWAVPVILGKDSWLTQLGWPWSSSWWRWVQLHPVPQTWTWGLHGAEEIPSYRATSLTPLCTPDLCFSWGWGLWMVHCTLG